VTRSPIELLTDHLIAGGAVRAGDGVITAGRLDPRAVAAEFSLRIVPVDRHLVVFEAPDTAEQLAVTYPVEPVAWCTALANAYSMVDQVIVTLEGGPLNFDRVVALFGSTLPGSPDHGLAERVESAVARLASGMLANGTFGSEVVPQGARAEQLAELFLTAGFGTGIDDPETVTLHAEQLGSIPAMLERAGLTEISRLLRY
jgi:hypothetical protein